jgi:hypothetical protein
LTGEERGGFVTKKKETDSGEREGGGEFGVIGWKGKRRNKQLKDLLSFLVSVLKFYLR